MEAFIAWINNPLVQSAIISPLVGAILGLLFGGFNTPPSPAAPATVQQTVIIFRQTVMVNQRGRASSSSDDIWGYAAALFIVLAVVIWGYSRYASDILHYWRALGARLMAGHLVSTDHLRIISGRSYV